jgi:hypothetical protein
MLFDIWRFIVKLLPIFGVVGCVCYILGVVGDSKIIKNKKAYKKWGLIIIGVTILFAIIQMLVTFFLISQYQYE